MIKKKWIRKCLKCGEELSYTRESDRNRAEKQNTNCCSCAKKGMKLSDEHKENISESLKGIKRSEETRKKISESKKGKNLGENNVRYWLGKTRSEETKQKIREKRKLQIMKPFTEEMLKKMRLSAIKRGIKFPNYNSKGCKIIDEYNRKYGYNFQHAENGGEVCIDGYWPDGLDEKRKTIIEIDESRHFNSDGTYKEKDIKRQKYLENLGYKVIRIKFKGAV